MKIKLKRLLSSIFNRNYIIFFIISMKDLFIYFLLHYKIEKLYMGPNRKMILQELTILLYFFKAYIKNGQ